MTARPQQPLLHRCACTSGISVSMLAVSALVHVTAHATALHTLRLFCDMQVGGYDGCDQLVGFTAQRGARLAH